MDTLAGFLDSHGYWVLLALGFAEYSGIPIASVPVLIGAGALASSGRLSLPLIVGFAALGGWLADAGWYAMARWQGCRLVGAACGLTSNRHACVTRVEGKVRRLGGAYVLSAKFLPGAGNLIAPAAGFAGLASLPFLLLDGIALLLWATVYTTLGWLFSDQVEAVLRIALGYSRWALMGLVVLVIGGVAARAFRLRRHGAAHRDGTVGAESVERESPADLPAGALP
ncbi:MAG: DedA family protein [Gemmatimonadota bacterium]